MGKISEPRILYNTCRIPYNFVYHAQTEIAQSATESEYITVSQAIAIYDTAYGISKVCKYIKHST